MTDTMRCGEPHRLHVKALELTGDDHACARRLLELITETNRTTLMALRDSVETAEWDCVGSAAHRIAGSARMFDCSDLLALLTQLETAAREREAAVATTLLPRVAEAVASLDRSIGSILGPTFVPRAANAS